MEMKNQSHAGSDSNLLLFTVLTAILVLGIGVSVAFNIGRNNPVKEDLAGVVIPMQASAKAEELHLSAANVTSEVNIANGQVEITLKPGATFQLPENTYLEAFLVDDGSVGDFGFSSANSDDEFYGTGLLDPAMNNALNAAPFVESLGRLKKLPEGEYALTFQVQNSLVPYDKLLITLESDRTFVDYDPRPAATLFSGDLLDTIKPRKVLEERKLRDRSVAP